MNLATPFASMTSWRVEDETASGSAFAPWPLDKDKPSEGGADADR